MQPVQPFLSMRSVRMHISRSFLPPLTRSLTAVVTRLWKAYTMPTIYHYTPHQIGSLPVCLWTCALCACIYSGHFYPFWPAHWQPSLRGSERPIKGLQCPNTPPTNCGVFLSLSEHALCAHAYSQVISTPSDPPIDSRHYAALEGLYNAHNVPLHPPLIMESACHFLSMRSLHIRILRSYLPPFDPRIDSCHYASLDGVYSAQSVPIMESSHPFPAMHTQHMHILMSFLTPIWPAHRHLSLCGSRRGSQCYKCSNYVACIPISNSFHPPFDPRIDSCHYAGKMGSNCKAFWTIHLQFRYSFICLWLFSIYIRPYNSRLFMIHVCSKLPYTAVS